LAVVALALLTVACVPPTRAGTVRTVVPLPTTCPEGGGPAVAPRTIAARNRRSALIAPAGYRPGVEYPLVVSLHPFILGPDAWETYSGLAAAASQRGYWVLLPQGSEPGPRWAVPGGLDTGPDDIAWVDSLIRETAATVCVDGDRVFAAGFSAGAAMSVGLSCELPGRFRAIAGSGGTNLTSLCPDAGPVDALILHGSADPIAPPSGSEVPFAPPLGLSVDEVVASFAGRNGCSPVPTAIQLSVSVVIDRYSCGGRRLEYFRMRGAGHTWAGSPIPLDIVTGPTDHTFSATNAVLDFFGAA
jgi:polyhydroxybutyrate depolymerase